MKIAAIIAEYNPFHNGHHYQIEETRSKTGADYILAVMSGDFVQRGGPALCNKHLRTMMALEGGVDAVIELPSLYAVSSAEFFAGGSIALLNQLGVVDILSFGSETGELSSLMDCARSLCTFNENYQSAIKEHLLEGCSYPAARGRVLDADSRRMLSSPNNILGLEYCKALFSSKSSIRPFTVKRQDAGYHQLDLNALPDTAPGHASASAIRRVLSSDPKKAASYVPDAVYRIFLDNHLSSFMVSENDFSGLLHYKLLSEAGRGFSSYLDCTCSLSDKIIKNLPAYTGFSDFCHLLKSRDLTYSRISRVLTHILLDIKTPEFYRPVLARRTLFVPYARLLGFRKTASPLLSQIKKHSEIPLISKPANASSLLKKDAFEMFQQDVYCACIYKSVFLDRFGKTPLNEWKQSPIILP